MLPDPLTVTEKLDLCEGGADVDWTDVFSAGRHLAETLIKHACDARVWNVQSVNGHFDLSACGHGGEADRQDLSFAVLRSVEPLAYEASPRICEVDVYHRVAVSVPSAAGPISFTVQEKNHLTPPLIFQY